jgi:hypothetical protein
MIEKGCIIIIVWSDGALDYKWNGIEMFLSFNVQNEDYDIKFNKDVSEVDIG